MMCITYLNCCMCHIRVCIRLFSPVNTSSCDLALHSQKLSDVLYSDAAVQTHTAPTKVQHHGCSSSAGVSALQRGNTEPPAHLHGNQYRSITERCTQDNSINHKASTNCVQKILKSTALKSYGVTILHRRDL